MLDKTQAHAAVATATSIRMDATMLPTVAISAVCADREHTQELNKNANFKTITTTTTTTSPTKKAKTLLNWLKSATTTTPTTTTIITKNTSDVQRIDAVSNINHNNNYNNNTNKVKSEASAEAEKLVAKEEASADTDCTCDIEKTRGNRRVADGTLRDFRGVQTLRHLWNKRISACEAANEKALGESKFRKLNKSVSCLVNAINNTRETPQNSHETRAKRALSLHDCTQLDAGGGEVDAALTEIDCLHRVKDNFYKYKNAEQAAQQFARATTSRRGATMVEEAHFPAVKVSERGERIQWLKRQDIMRGGAGGSSGAVVKRNGRGSAAVVVGSLSAGNGDVIAVCKDNNVNVNQIPNNINNNNNNNKVSDDNYNNNNNNDNSETSSVSGETLTAGNSPMHEVSLRERSAECGRSALSSASDSKRGSTDSLTSSLRSASGSTSTVKSQGGRRSSSRRKYSFKTHAGKAYHQHHHHQVTRRTSMNKDSVVGGGGGITIGGAVNTAQGYSKVAKLTQQFNDIIQKDKRLLEEVKRKNGVWLSRGTHVYKVVKTSSLPSNNASSLSRNSSKTKEDSDRLSSLVQCTINKFEHCQVRPIEPKPTVPVKSAQVLRKHKELVAHSRPNTLALNNGRGRRTLPSLNQQSGEPKLEVVCEEAKTPLDVEESSSLANVVASMQTTNALEVDKVNDMGETLTVNYNADVTDAMLVEAKNNSVIGTARTVEHEIASLTVSHDSDDETLDPEVAAANAEKLKQRKHKYAKIYEKFRFRSPFGGNAKKLTTSTAQVKDTSAVVDTSKEIKPAIEIATVEMNTTTQIVEADAKILDALEVIDQKLKGLTVNRLVTLDDAVASNDELLLTTDNDFEQRILPNTSFVHQNAQISNNQLLVTQAVNVALVNAIEGEQMIMEQKELHEVVKDQVEHSIGPQQEEPIYEPIAQNCTAETVKTKTEPQKSFLFSSPQKTMTDVPETLPVTEDIYQTVEEAQAELTKEPNWMEDYESIAGSCEQTASIAPTMLKVDSYDGYESFEPVLEDTVVSLGNALPTTPTSPNVVLMRNTNDELPELPKPKRRLPKSPMPGKRSPPARPSHKDKILKTEITANESALLTEPEEHHYYADDDENIYDTIKGGSHCYESVQKSSSSGSSTMHACTDSISVTSNCYESITHFRRGNNVGSNCQINSTGAGSSGGSTLTISSDHKTNSLYEMSLAASMVYGTGSLSCRSRRSSTAGSSGQSSAGPQNGVDAFSIGVSSDNSDGWVDISDGEVEATEAKQQFIVVRERSKTHRSPDWSKRIRDKRLQQKKAISYIEDDSDHYYETLSPLGNRRPSTLNRSRSHHKRTQDLPRLANTKQLHAPIGSDDYDSFSDTDEQEEHLNNQNDSGVDIRNHRLPEPPQSTNQVYAIVRKLKNFISNKKSPSVSGSQQKLYENTSQFYVESGTYDKKAKPPKLKYLKYGKKLPPPTNPEDIYENSEFHSPPPAINNIKDAKSLSTSERNLISNAANANDSAHMSVDVTSTTPRSKPSTGKSFSRLRKSLGGGSSSHDTKHLSTLSSSRSTFYIEDPSQLSDQFDSGFLEKASSGDIPNVQQQTVPSAESQKFSTVARKTKKAKEANNANRRRTTIGIRPHEPPPPPPEDKSNVAKQQASSTSWYAECGVFKQNTELINGDGVSTLDDSSISGGGNKSTTNSQSGGGGSSWYTEAGLYQTSGVSVASSSGSSGVSTGNEAGLGDEMTHSLFDNEPLYQIYNAAKLESITRDLEEHRFADGYEEIGQRGRSANRRESDVRKSLRPSALQLVEPTNGPARTLWSQIPEVINSCILPTLTPRERGLQEAKFEIVTSEASYLKSLNLLRSHFMNNTVFRDTQTLSSRDRKALFSYIVPVHECSEHLLTELESCWQDNIMLLGLSKRIYNIAEKHFHVYIAFCEHQGRMDRTLRRLKETKGCFQQQLEKLESSPSLCGLNLHSFLMLPMQRITRLPLLIDAVFSKVAPNDDEYENWKMTLAIMNKIVTQCNEAANRCEQAYEIERISRQLEFPTSIRALAIAPAGVPVPGSKPRFLVKKGELTHLIWRGEDAKLTFGKRFTKATIFAFLFSDLLVLTKRKGEEQFTVIDYCPRSMLTIASGDTLPQLPTKDINQTGKNLILMTLLENHERKTIELVLSCPSVSEQERWLQAMRPPEAETPGEKLYEAWDCPQVIAKHDYESDEPDVLSLDIGDVVNVTRKLPDGWYQGERIRDGAIGWFPGSFTEEVNSAHVRARNLKQRYRLLTFTATYLESQKRK